MAVSVTHDTVATLPNDPSKEVSSDAWNAGHTVEGLGDAAEKNVGTAVGTVAAGDHNHDADYDAAGSAAAAQTAAEGTAAAALTAHVGAADPHTGYQKESEKNAANGYAGLSASSKIDGAQQTYGSAANTACVGNDSRLSDSRAPSGNAGGDLGGTYPNPTVTQARGLRTTTGPTTLAMGAVADGEFLKRSGTDIVGAAAAGGAAWGGITGTLADQTDLQTALDAKVPTARTLSNGFGITGGGDLSANRTLAVSLTSTSAFATATTTISAATYADITGCSVSLAAGTWLIIGQVNIEIANAIIQAFVAITDGSNTVISEVAASRPASGTASLASPFSCNPIAIVSPGSTTTYKLRGARGLTTHTGSWTAMDGNGVNTTNHLTNNTDKGSGIFAVRIA